MALIDIEYGSLASSDTMNKNFIYLDNKISESSDSIMTSISSLFSNIATLNSRINDVTESMEDSLAGLLATIEEYKRKTKLLVNKASMVPDWRNCFSVEITTEDSYTVPSNGYLLLLPVSTVKGRLLINEVDINLKNRANSYDNASQLVVLPVFSGDVVSSDVEFTDVYFLPSRDVGLDNF